MRTATVRKIDPRAPSAPVSPPKVFLTGDQETRIFGAIGNARKKIESVERDLLDRIHAQDIVIENLRSELRFMKEFWGGTVTPADRAKSANLDGFITRLLEQSQIITAAGQALMSEIEARR